MSSDEELAALLGRRADGELLSRSDALLPAETAPALEHPPDPARERIVAIGVTLTGASLIGGIALMLIALVAIISGGEGVAGIVGLVLGALLAGTHWGWVHVAEVTANRRTERRDRELDSLRSHWLGQIAPHARWAVSTSVRDDGAIEIVRARYEPVPLGEDRFTLARSVEKRELHLADEPGAAVTERAELMRREAAAATQRERDRYEAAATAYGDATLRDADERERLAAARAASQALSERINANLRDPPLIE
jgi:hypothetical protein